MRWSIYTGISLIEQITSFIDWDSISSEPEGLLYGNRFHLGNFDECMKAPWYKEHPELRTQYCLTDIVLERTDRAVKKAADPFNPYESALNVIEVSVNLVNKHYVVGAISRCTCCSQLG